MALLDGWAFCSAEMRERANPAGAESSADDLSLGLGAVLGRAATSLRSIETHPRGRLVRPLLEGHRPAAAAAATPSPARARGVEEERGSLCRPLSPLPASTRAVFAFSLFFFSFFFQSPELVSIIFSKNCKKKFQRQLETLENFGKK